MQDGTNAHAHTVGATVRDTVLQFGLVVRWLVGSFVRLALVVYVVGGAGAPSGRRKSWQIFSPSVGADFGCGKTDIPTVLNTQTARVVFHLIKFKVN